MSRVKCPGQDSRFFKAQDVAEVTCPECGRAMEFWPDELMRRCPGCGRRTSNPRLNLRCLEWCAHAEACLEQIRSPGVSPEQARYLAKKHRADDAADVKWRGSLPSDD